MLEGPARPCKVGATIHPKTDSIAEYTIKAIENNKVTLKRLVESPPKGQNGSTDEAEEEQLTHIDTNTLYDLYKATCNPNLKPVSSTKFDFVALLC